MKLMPRGEIAKYKAMGFVHKSGLDYIEVCAPVARLETVRLVVVVACNRNWSLDHLDVKSAFLNGPLEDEVYVVQPPFFVIKGKEKMVYKLNKAL